MKTKYVKVPVSERLPNKEEEFLTSKGELYFSIERKQFETYKNTRNSNPSFWLEEKEDHSEEMLSMLEEVKNKFKPSLSHPLEEGQEEFINQIEEL
ncbi:hypothetical protein LX74_04050, partial [Elizabethkingia miricola]